MRTREVVKVCERCDQHPGCGFGDSVADQAWKVIAFPATVCVHALCGLGREEMQKARQEELTGDRRFKYPGKPPFILDLASGIVYQERETGGRVPVGLKLSDKV